MCKCSIWQPKYTFLRNAGFLEGLRGVFGLTASFSSPWASVTFSKQKRVQLKLLGLHTADVMELMFAEWEDGERFSFEDSDRFEEDSLCSFISEAESLCQNWRGWRKQSAGPNSPTVKIKGNGRSSLCAVKCFMCCHCSTPFLGMTALLTLECVLNLWITLSRDLHVQNYQVKPPPYMALFWQFSYPLFVLELSLTHYTLNTIRGVRHCQEYLANFFYFFLLSNA